MKNFSKNLFIIIFLTILPTRCWASLSITEIMYDPEGTDVNHEWVEIRNDSNEEIDISAWKFFENNSNHSLTSVVGGTVLSAGSFAIIADNAQTFLTDYPNFIGILFDSVFSLNNSGETIALKDELGNIINEAIYTSSDGANGDGKSLSGGQSTWLPKIPSPGSETTGTPVDNQDDDDSQQDEEINSTIIPSTQSEKKKVQKNTTVKISAPQISFSDDSIFFSAKIIDVYGSQIFQGRFYWNFGDGFSMNSINTSSVSHIFPFPGRYLVSVEYFEQYYDQEPKAVDRQVLTIFPPQFEFSDNGLTLSLKNTSKNEVDASGWYIENFENKYVFPRKTIFLPGSTIIFIKQYIGLSLIGEYNLKYPNSNLVIRASTDTGLFEVINSENTDSKVESKQKIEEVNIIENVPEIENTFKIETPEVENIFEAETIEFESNSKSQELQNQEIRLPDDELTTSGLEIITSTENERIVEKPSSKRWFSRFRNQILLLAGVIISAVLISKLIIRKG